MPQMLINGPASCFLLAAMDLQFDRGRYEEEDIRIAVIRLLDELRILIPESTEWGKQLASVIGDAARRAQTLADSWLPIEENRKREKERDSREQSRAIKHTTIKPLHSCVRYPIEVLRDKLELLPLAGISSKKPQRVFWQIAGDDISLANILRGLCVQAAFAATKQFDADTKSWTGLTLQQYLKDATPNTLTVLALTALKIAQDAHTEANGAAKSSD